MTKNEQELLLKKRILKRAEECKKIYEKRGFFSVGDVARFDFPPKKVREILKDWKQEVEGYFHINDNYKRD
jgi:hypothetical protein